MKITAGLIINDHIKKEDLSFHYSSIDDAVALLSEYGQSAMMAKIAITESCLPPDSSTSCRLGAPEHGQLCMDTSSFGLHSAPSFFNNYAYALHWILARNSGARLLHYLDDFLLVDPPGPARTPVRRPCMYRMLLVCGQLGIPVAPEKLEGPTTSLIFLGIMLDTSA